MVTCAIIRMKVGVLLEFLCIDILNSNRVDWQHSEIQRDMLDNQEWRQALAQKWNLNLPTQLSAAESVQLKKLREDMRTIVNQLPQHPDNLVDALKPINEIFERISSVYQVNYNNLAFTLDQVTNAEGWELFTWHIALSFSQMLTQHELTRIKSCDNQDCQWTFYDDTKNTSRRWCDKKVCGNIMKVRNFRARKKEQQK